jgi:hypothetical protein
MERYDYKSVKTGLSFLYVTDHEIKVRKTKVVRVLN